MASNPIVIQISDGIDSAVAVKITAIGTAAETAYKQVETLKQALTAINSGSLQGLKSQLDSTGNSTAQLQNNLTKLTATNASLVNSTSQVTAATQASVQQTVQAANAAAQLATARTTLNTATKNLSNVQQQLGQSAAAGNVQAQQIIAGYKQQQLAAAQLVAQLKAAQVAQSNFGKQQTATGAAAHGSVSGVQAASAAIRGLEGNFGTSVRAGERFLVTTLKLGPILQAAFPVFGALALIGILGILYDHIQNLIRAFKEMDVASLKTETDAIAAGDRIVKAKRESLLSAFNFARILKGGPDNPDTLDVISAREALKTLEWKKQIALIDAQNLEKGKTGLALQKAKEFSLQREIDLTTQQQVLAQKVADSIRQQLDATVQVGKRRTDNYKDRLNPAKPITYEPILAPQLSDPNQRKALGEQLKIASDGVRDLGHEIEVLQHQQSGLRLKEPLAELHDSLKAARLQLSQFKNEFADFERNLGRPITAQDKITFFTDQLKRAVPTNKPEINSRLAVAIQEQERQKQSYELLTERINDQKSSIGEYSDALRAKNAWDKIDLQLKRDGIVLTEDQTKALRETVKYIADNARFERELKTTYEQFNGPLKTYEASLRAINQLETEHAITQEEATIATRQANLAYDNAIHPLSEYRIGLQNEIELFGKYGIELTVATELQRVQNELRLKGRTLSEAESTALRAQLTSLAKQKEIQGQVNKLYQDNIGLVQRLIQAQTALIIARQKGIITSEQEKVGLAKAKVAIADLQIQLHKATGKDILTSVFGSYLKDFEGFTKGVSNLWNETFRTLADGAANSIGRAIVYGENLGDALKEVARSALSELISGMIKLGIQTIITHIIGRSAAAATVAASVTEAAAVASAWAPAAAAVSLATFGANGVPADIAIATTYGLTTLLSALHFNKGGLVPGNGTADVVPAMLTPGEFVLKQSAVSAIGLSTLQAMNNGYVQHGATSGYAGYGSQINVEVIHDGSTGISVEQIDDNRIRIIAKQEAKAAVEQHAPGVVAADMTNPNSKTSKSIKTNFQVTQRR
jgi:hypothetical protein